MADLFTVQVEGDLAQALTDIASAVSPNMQWMVQETATALTSEMRRLAPLGRHFSAAGAQLPGGTLRRSLRFEVGDLGAILMGVGYGRYVIAGTRAHPIVARQARALRFFWERAGTTFIGRKVQHPGTMPNDFRWKALEAAMEGQVLSRIADQMLGATVEGRVL